MKVTKSNLSDYRSSIQCLYENIKSINDDESRRSVNKVQNILDKILYFAEIVNESDD